MGETGFLRDRDMGETGFLRDRDMGETEFLRDRDVEVMGEKMTWLINT